MIKDDANPSSVQMNGGSMSKKDFDSVQSDEYLFIPMGGAFNRGYDKHAKLVKAHEEESEDAMSEVGGSLIMGFLLTAFGAPHWLHSVAEMGKTIGEAVMSGSSNVGQTVQMQINKFAKNLNPSESYKPMATEGKGVFSLKNPFAIPNTWDESSNNKRDKKEEEKKCYQRLFGRG